VADVKNSMSETLAGVRARLILHDDRNETNARDTFAGTRVLQDRRGKRYNAVDERAIADLFAMFGIRENNEYLINAYG
jgi:hypothetical protein